MSRVINSRNSRVLVEKLERATKLKERLVGLIGRPSLEEGHGLWIDRSGNSIHTCLMKFPIDVLFVNKKGEVKHAAAHVKPWRLIFAPLIMPTDVLELPAGTIDRCETRVGDVLRVEN